MTHDELVAAYAELLQRVTALEEHATRPKPATKGARIPQPFLVTPEMRKWAAVNHKGVDITQATQEFVDYWRGVPGQRGCKLDWPATWRNAIRLYERRQPGLKLNGNRHKAGSYDDWASKHAVEGEF